MAAEEEVEEKAEPKDSVDVGTAILGGVAPSGCPCGGGGMDKEETDHHRAR